MFFANRFRPRLTRLAVGLSLFALFNIVVVNEILEELTWRGESETALSHVKDFRRHKQGTDSWWPMATAFQITQTEGRRPLYTELFFDRKMKFQYPPSSLLFLYIFKWADPDTLEKGKSGGDALQVYRPWYRVLNRASRLCVFITILLVVLIFLRALGDTARENGAIPSWGDKIVLAVMAALLAVTFYPLIKAYTLGQIQTVLNVFFAAAVWLWMRNRRIVPGVLLGLITLVKPQSALLLLWCLLRRQWACLISFAVVLGAGLLASVLAFGITDHVDYLRVLSFISKHGEAFYPNQSVNGLLNRLLQNGNNTNWDFHQFAPYNIWVYAGTTLTSVVLVVLALWPPKKREQTDPTADMLLAALCASLASPVVWEHHYGILLPMYVYLLPHVMTRKVFGRFTIPCLAISYVLASQLILAANHLAPTILNVAQSYLFFAGLIVLVYLVRLRRAKDASGGGQHDASPTAPEGRGDVAASASATRDGRP